MKFVLGIAALVSFVLFMASLISALERGPDDLRKYGMLAASIFLGVLSVSCVLAAVSGWPG